MKSAYLNNDESTMGLICPSPASTIQSLRAYLPLTATNSIKPPCDKCATNTCDIKERRNHAPRYAYLVQDELQWYTMSPEMMRDVEKFKSFPGSHEIFKDQIPQGYQTKPVIYKNLKGESFIAKNDVFLFIQEILATLVQELQHETPEEFLGLFLKLQEKKLQGSLDFIHWSDDNLDFLKFDLMQHMLQKADEHNTPRQYTVEELLEMYKALIPGEWDSVKYGHLELVVKEMQEIGTEHIFYIKVFKVFLPRILLLIEQNGFNVPNSQLPKDKKLLVVRLFTDGDRKFVLKEELEALNNPEGFDSSSKDPLANLETIEGTVALRLINAHPEHVEVLLTPITRTKLRVVPIRIQDGKFCKPAVDVLLEIFQDLVFGLKVFQKVQKTENGHWDLVETFFKKLEDTFPCDKKESFFITDEKIKILTEFTLSHFSPLASIEAKDLDLKNETRVKDLFDNLEFLGLTKIFLDIKEEASEVEIHYNQFMNKPNYKCKNMEAIRDVMFMRILKEFPKLAQFLHSQDACSRLISTNCCRRGQMHAYIDNIFAEIAEEDRRDPHANERAMAEMVREALETPQEEVEQLMAALRLHSQRQRKL